MSLIDDQIHTDASLDSISISVTDVSDVLKCLDTSKAVGPDLIKPRMLKEDSDTSAKPLSNLFNLSLQQQHFPSSWKVANVVHVFKKADPKKVENYRTISLLSIIGKVFENACLNIYITS